MPTAAYNKFQPFVAAVHNGKHNLATDQLRLALVNSPAPSAANAILTDLTQVAYTNLQGGVTSLNVPTTSSTQTGGTYKLVLGDVTLVAAGGAIGPFRYVAIYNFTAANKDLIGYFDYGSPQTINDAESFVVDLDQANGFYTAT